jgi:hypothetical protein
MTFLQPTTIKVFDPNIDAHKKTPEPLNSGVTM